MSVADNNYPENDKDTLFIYVGMGRGGDKIDFAYMMDQITRHFGEDIALSDLDITSEYVHTRCIHYDLYDQMDYDTYIIITRKE